MGDCDRKQRFPYMFFRSLVIPLGLRKTVLSDYEAEDYLHRCHFVGFPSIFYEGPLVS